LRSKTITIALVALIAVLMGVYFTLRSPVFTEDSLTRQADQVKSYVREGDWERARAAARGVQDIWERQKYLVMLNYAEADFADFEKSLSTIIGGVEGRDEAAVYASVKALKSLWENLTKFVPEP